MTVLRQILSDTSDRAVLVDNLKNYLSKKRQEILDLHKGGASGLYIAARIASLTDEIITELYNYEFNRYESSHNLPVKDRCSVIAVGGYGRGELNPFSDIDIMFLYSEDAKDAVETISAGILYLLWDLKYNIGHSLRTIEDCIKISGTDFTARTALMESRLITGSELLFNEFHKTFMEKVITRNVRAYIDERMKNMQDRYRQFGTSVYLVEPNVKEGKGGLRDIHCLRWVTIARYRIDSLAEFHKQGYITKVGYQELTDAKDFMLRVRNELHFHANKAADVLTVEDQWRISKLFGYTDETHRLGVETFMKDYYMHASHIHDISVRAIEKALPVQKWKKGMESITSRFVKPCYVLTRDTIHVPERYQEVLLRDGKNAVYLFYLSLIHNLRISTHTMSMLYRNSASIPDDLNQSPEVNKIFRMILSWPQGMADTAREMHKVKLLQKIIPEFGKISCYASYDYYHKYTVDEHSFLAVQMAEELLISNNYISKVYREIKRKDLLHLALLLHDAGKGSGEDHSIRGELIATRVAQQLGFNEDETAILALLVRHHLVMPNIAFRRDLSDTKVILLIARLVAKPEVLKKLFILSYADINAVGPDTWNEWKENLLSELYIKVLEELTGTRVTYSEEELIARIKKNIGEKLCLIYPPDWLDEQLHCMETRYLLITPPEKIMNHLQMINQLRKDTDARVLVDVILDRGIAEFTIYTYDNITPGIFSKIAGVLAAAGYNILDVQIYTTKRGIVIDTFRARDPYPEGVSSQLRQTTVRKHIYEVLTGAATVENMFLKYSGKLPRKKTIPVTAQTQVEIDNESSDDFTIIDIFAADKQGLLYVITRTIFELGLLVFSSKIATHVEQIVDVFYVKDLSGNKIAEPERIAEIKHILLNAIEMYQRS
ncbi:MAG: [protein-PII] uridylyltransferase [Nitrospirae bacterium]|nr:[protein-PII] uridylyltransferase [Nitrospirota bacterium]